MNKYKALGTLLMVVVLLQIFASYKLGALSLQFAVSGVSQFLFFLSVICFVLFGSLAALTLDKMPE